MLSVAHTFYGENLWLIFEHQHIALHKNGIILLSIDLAEMDRCESN
jgi:hypothetical protein